MPHFTRQFHNHAPVVDAVFHISEPCLRLLTDGGRERPRPLVGQALLDTGAGCTCVDPAVTHALGLEPRGVEDVYTPSTGDDPHTTTQYDLSIIIPPASAQDALVLKAFPVIHSEAAARLYRQGVAGCVEPRFGGPCGARASAAGQIAGARPPRRGGVHPGGT